MRPASTACGLTVGGNWYASPPMSKSIEIQPITVGELIDRLAAFPRDADVIFGGSKDTLTLYRLKMRGEKLVQFEFNELVYRDQSGKVVAPECDKQ